MRRLYGQLGMVCPWHGVKRPSDERRAAYTAAFSDGLPFPTNQLWRHVDQEVPSIHRMS